MQDDDSTQQGKQFAEGFVQELLNETDNEITQFSGLAFVVKGRVGRWVYTGYTDNPELMILKMREGMAMLEKAIREKASKPEIPQ